MKDHRQALIHSSADCNWRTPPEMADKLCRLFYCAIDLAAAPGIAVCGLPYLGPGSDSVAYDALAVSWYDTAVRLGLPPIGFLNPPYSLKKRSELLKAGIPAEELRWLEIESWAKKAYEESLAGFTTIGVFPYSPQTEWFRGYVMGHTEDFRWWAGHAALDYWKIPYRVSYAPDDATKARMAAEFAAGARKSAEATGAGVNTCVIHWGPNPGFVGPWVPSGRYWSYR